MCKQNCTARSCNCRRFNVICVYTKTAVLQIKFFPARYICNLYYIVVLNCIVCPYNT